MAILSAADVPEMRRMYLEDGLTLEAIGNRYGVSWTTVRYWLHRDGVVMRTRGYTRPPSTEEVGLMARLYLEEGLSLRRVGLEVGRSRTAVLKYLRGAGVDTSRKRSR